LLAVGTDKQFVELLLALGLDGIADDTRFSSNERRVANRQVLSTLIGAAVQRLESEKLMNEVHVRKIPAGLILNVQEALESDASRELLLRADGLAGMRTFVSLIDGNRAASQALSPPPHFGEHTSEVLSALSAQF